MKTSPPIKTKIPRLSPHLVAASFLALSLIPTPSVRAQLYWDGLQGSSSDTGNADGGPGLWNTTTTNWDTAATAGSATAWTNANNDTAVFGGTAGTVTLGTGITVGGLQFDTTGYNVTGVNTLTFGAPGNIFVNENQAATISSVITATAGTQITKTGLGTLTLSGLNTFNAFSISEGTVKSGSVNALGLTGNRITIAANAKWDLNGYNTSGQTSLNGGGDIINSRTGTTSQTNLNLGGKVGGPTSTFTGKILQTPGNIISVTKAGDGTQILTSTENTFTGQLIIANQSLIVASLGKGTGINEIGSNGSGNILMGNEQNSAKLTYTGDGDVDASTRNIQLYGNKSDRYDGDRLVTEVAVDSSSSNGLGTGTLILGGAFASTKDTSSGVNKRLTLKGTNTGANTMTGVISNYGDGTTTSEAIKGDSRNVLSLTKSDGGTWVLSGNNTYTGDTTVSGGKLLINGDQSSASGAVSVASGATLGGSGKIGGATTIASGGSLDNKDGAIGTLTFNSTLEANGATFSLELNSATGVADKLVVLGQLLGDGNTLSLKDIGDSTPILGQEFDIMTYAAGSVTTSFFNNLEAGNKITVKGITYQLTYGGTSITLKALSAIPEPASYAALAGLGILGFAVYRRRPKA